MNPNGHPPYNNDGLLVSAHPQMPQSIASAPPPKKVDLTHTMHSPLNPSQLSNSSPCSVVSTHISDIGTHATSGQEPHKSHIPRTSQHSISFETISKMISDCSDDKDCESKVANYIRALNGEQVSGLLQSIEETVYLLWVKEAQETDRAKRLRILEFDESNHGRITQRTDSTKRNLEMDYDELSGITNSPAIASAPQKNENYSPQADFNENSTSLATTTCQKRPRPISSRDD